MTQNLPENVVNTEEGRVQLENELFCAAILEARQLWIFNVMNQ